MIDLTLKPEAFAVFFRTLWGYSPFPWQERLLLSLVAESNLQRAENGPHVWPDVLDLPTGAGKTAALDIVVFHLALEADKGEARRAPLRIAYVVDRRLIVDDAYARAELLCAALRWSLLGANESQAEATKIEAQKPHLIAVFNRIRAEEIVKRVALRLRRLAGEGQPPLLARALRGGAPREDDWARTPVQPTILCSTVDQVGSRLLFRGYGVSDSMKPIHAGLLGSDCVILLDEAHLSEPFRQTLNAVQRLRKPDTAPFEFAVLTATPTIKAERPFGLSAEDEADRTLSRRIGAAKPVRLCEIAGKQGVDTESRRTEFVAAEALSVLAALRAAIANPAVGVVVNRVARARAVFERLRSKLAESADVMLVIGPARAADRDRLAKLADIRTGRDDLRGAMTKPLVVVATQTIEAGVDIDFDGLVTEAAALDALRQRFGRLNRAGRDIKSEAVVLAHKEDIGARADDTVYGDRIAKTWEALNRWKAGAADGRLDFGIDAMKAALASERVSDLTAEPLDAPVLMPAYADLWSQTSPIPNADPDVALFLHGPNRSPAGVQIVWRADIEEDDLRAARTDPSGLTELLALAPPRAAEAIEVPIWAARAWLRQVGARGADFPDVTEREYDGAGGREARRPVFRWAGKDDTRTGVIRADALHPGDMIVAPAAYGGCDSWGWAPSETSDAIDVADRAAEPYSAQRYVVRIAARLIEQALHAEGRNDASGVVEELRSLLAETEDQASAALLQAVRELESLPQAIKRRLEALDRRKRQIAHAFAYGRDSEQRPRGVVFAALRGLEADDEEDFAATPSTENDELSVLSDRPLGLREHCEHVRDWAATFAARAGLAPPCVADVKLAAFLHDVGKADPRFQAHLAGGDPYGPDIKEALAKSGQKRLPPGARERAGLPDRWRHEALSVRIARRLAPFERAHDRLLVLWLIGSHHGYGRPLFPHADAKDDELRRGVLKACGGDGDLAPDDGPQALAFDFDGLDWTQMFEVLKARYGIWGLARLEAFVRLADHRASEAGMSPKAVRPYKDAAE